MRRLLALLFACMALGLVAAGCGGDDDDDGGGGGGGGGGAASDQPPDAGGSGPGADVQMAGISFSPAEVTIKAGETVTWTNNDPAGHDVTGDDFKSGDPGGIANGQTFEHTFEEAGTFDYVCSVHPGMEGTVKVE